MSSEVLEGWNPTTLGAIAYITRGVSWRDENETSPTTAEALPVLGIRNVQQSLKLDETVWLAGLSQKAVASSTVRLGDILMVGSNGNPARIGNAVRIDVPGVYLYASLLFGIRPDETRVDSEFLFHLIRSSDVQQAISDTVQGSTGLANLKITVLRDIPLLLPPIDEQRRIAGVLRSIDAAIRAASDAAHQAQRSYRQLLATLTTPSDPSEWRECQVSDVCSILDSKRVPLNSSERRNRKGIYPYWGANGIVDYIDDYIFDEPLVLMAEDGGYFEEASSRPICHRLDGKVWVNNHAHVLRAEGVNRDYLFFWFVHRDITHHIKGGTRTKLNQGDLKRLPIKFPSIDEQLLIVRRLDDALSAALEAEAVVKQSRSLKSIISDDLLSGRVRVPA